MRRWLRAAAAAVLIGLAAIVAGCGFGVDGGQVRLCRQIIAGLEGVEAIEVTSSRAISEPGRFGRGPGDGVALTYRVRDVSGVAVGPERQVWCLFDPSRPSERLVDRLNSVMTQAGELSPARLYMLKRFWLDAEAGAGATDPEPIAGAERAPEIARPIAVGLQALLSGLPKTVLLALLAAAYALIHGLVGRINLAFGDLVTVGGYAALIGIAWAGGPIAVVAVAILSAATLALWSAASVATLSSRFVFEPIDRVEGQAPLIASAGLAIVLSEAVRLAKSGGPKSGPPLLNEPVALARAGDFIVAVPPIIAVAAALGLLGLAVLFAGLTQSGLGRAWRAAADDPLAAALMGIGPRWIHGMTFLAAGCLAGLGGAISALTYGSLAYAGGLTVGLEALIAALIAGTGSIGGAVLCGALIGFAEALWSALLPIEHRDAMLFTLLIGILVVRPGGVFGRPELERSR